MRTYHLSRTRSYVPSSLRLRAIVTESLDLKHNKCVCKVCSFAHPPHALTDVQHGFNPVKENGKLVACIPCPPTPSKRALETAAPVPVEFRTVEDALGCSAVQTACKIGSAWTCFE